MNLCGVERFFGFVAVVAIRRKFPSLQFLAMIILCGPALGQ